MEPVETVKFELISSGYSNTDTTRIINESLVAGFGPGNPFNWVIPNVNARVQIMKKLGNKIINQDPPHSHLLFQETQDKTNPAMIGHTQLMNNKDLNLPKDVLTNGHESQLSICAVIKTILSKIWNELDMALKIGIFYPYRALCFNTAKALTFQVFEARYTKHYWYIGFFCINPKYAKKGYGSKMLKLSHEKIKEYQLKDNEQNDDELLSVMLWAYNPYAVKLYLKHGYKIFVEINVNKDHKLYGLYYEYDTAINEEDIDEKIVIDLGWADLLPDLEMNRYGFIFMVVVLSASPFIVVALCVIFLLRLFRIGRWDLE